MVLFCTFVCLLFIYKRNCNATSAYVQRAKMKKKSLNFWGGLKALQISVLLLQKSLYQSTLSLGDC